MGQPNSFFSAGQPTGFCHEKTSKGRFESLEKLNALQLQTTCVKPSLTPPKVIRLPTPVYAIAALSVFPSRFPGKQPATGTGNTTGKSRKPSRTGKSRKPSRTARPGTLTWHGAHGRRGRGGDAAGWSSPSPEAGGAQGAREERRSPREGAAASVVRCSTEELRRRRPAASAPSRRPRPPSRTVASRSLSRPYRVPLALPLEQGSPTRTAESAPRRPGPAVFLQLRRRHRVFLQLRQPPLLREPAGRHRGRGKLPPGRGAPRGIDVGALLTGEGGGGEADVPLLAEAGVGRRAARGRKEAGTALPVLVDTGAGRGATREDEELHRRGHGEVRRRAPSRAAGPLLPPEETPCVPSLCLG
jgi:hypothetical protein